MRINIQFLFVVFLCLFYCWVLFLAVSPQVTAEYRAYYIERSTDEWRTVRYLAALNEQSNLVKIDAKLNGSNNNVAVFQGWHNPELKLRWSALPKAKIFFRSGLPKIVDGKISIVFVYILDKEVLVEINDVNIGICKKENLFNNVCHLAFEKLPFEKLNRVALSIDRVSEPGNGDPRLLGIAISEIEIITQ